MEKEFTRSRVREISERIQDSLNELGKELGIELTLASGNFTTATFKFNLEGRMKDSDGKIMATDYSHSLADSAAKSVGLVIEGHLIGSLWKVKDTVYTVTDYKTKRPKYPLSLMTSEGRSVKSSVGFLRQGKQLLAPTEEEFYKWLVIDPDEDSVRESDVEIVDRVQEYFEVAYLPEQSDDFLNKAAQFTEIGITKVGASKIYDKFTRFGIVEAAKFMAEMLEMPKYKGKKK